MCAFWVIGLVDLNTRPGRGGTKEVLTDYLISKLEGVAKMASNGIMIAGAEIKHLYSGEWPSGKATDFESVYRGFESLLPSLS
jgi:hypothetical protein